MLRFPCLSLCYISFSFLTFLILSIVNETLNKFRADISTDSKQNFILERELNDLDNKIKLLIKNKISVQEIMASSSGIYIHSREEKSAPSRPATLPHRELYENLFYLLQHQPRYCASLARLVTSLEIPMYVQTVVFDMYGDQYDTREERLLLSLFQMVLTKEFENALDMGSFLRENTALTQMLSAYAKRGQGLSILRDTLLGPVSEISSSTQNLEIEPLKVCFAGNALSLLYHMPRLFSSFVCCYPSF